MAPLPVADSGEGAGVVCQILPFFFCNKFKELQTVLFELCYTNCVIIIKQLISNTTDNINRISNKFLDRWRHGYVVNLCETQRT